MILKRVFYRFLIFTILIISILPITNSNSDTKNGWGIDYNHPEKYLIPGLQSKISSQDMIESLKVEFKEINGLEGLRDIYLWLHDFSTYKGGGKLIGKTNIDQLLKSRKLSGCSDNALVFSAVARYLGYPTVMVDTAGLEWGEKYQAGLTTSYVGHVFVEVYISDKWIIIDPTSGKFIREYDIYNPIIPITTGDENTGFYALLKGKDMWDYGVTEPDILLSKLRAFAKSFDPDKIDIPSYKIERLTSLKSVLKTTPTTPPPSPSLPSEDETTSTPTISPPATENISEPGIEQSLNSILLVIVIILLIVVLAFVSRRSKARATPRISSAHTQNSYIASK